MSIGVTRTRGAVMHRGAKTSSDTIPERELQLRIRRRRRAGLRPVVAAVSLVALAGIIAATVVTAMLPRATQEGELTAAVAASATPTVAHRSDPAPQPFASLPVPEAPLPAVVPPAPDAASKAAEAAPPTPPAVTASASLDLPVRLAVETTTDRTAATGPTVRTAAIEPAAIAVPQQAAPSARGPSSAEVATLMSRARDRVRQGDIAGARRLLERASAGDDSNALFALAETHDASVLARWGVIGTKPDNAMARSLYERAASQGASAARERLLAMAK